MSISRRLTCRSMTPAVHAKFRLVFPKRRLGEPAGQKRGLQPHRAERRAELVRGDRQKFVAGGHRGPKVRDQAMAVLLRDGAQFTLVLQVLVQREQADQQFATDVGRRGGQVVVRDPAAPGADFGQVLQDAVGGHLPASVGVVAPHRWPPPRCRRTKPAVHPWNRRRIGPPL